MTSIGRASRGLWQGRLAASECLPRALRLVELLFGTLTHGVAGDWIAGDARADELAGDAFRFLTNADVLAYTGLSWPWRQRFYQSMCVQDRLRFAYDTVLAPTTLEWTAAPLPAWLGWMYPGIRIARLTEKHAIRPLLRRAKHAHGDRALASTTTTTVL